jgi:hypothetical protein
MSEIYAWTHTDLQDFALGKRDNFPTNFPNRWWVTQSSHQLGIDMISVEGHGTNLFSPTDCLAPGERDEEGIIAVLIVQTAV